MMMDDGEKTMVSARISSSERDSRFSAQSVNRPGPCVRKHARQARRKAGVGETAE